MTKTRFYFAIIMYAKKPGLAGLAIDVGWHDYIDFITGAPAGKFYLVLEYQVVKFWVLFGKANKYQLTNG